ncbi:nucleotide-binding universal stress UspA family protein [Gillisia sp. Hel_I_86]|uniref:universal stress protein n=1 Tax=Gillisia sp. Hel_I_86 TaxID=1249981 RepID=UPI0011990EE1|nr:universal stress protein [Gillisia sp. Hel_I_86]TVZ27190.1 nucleotide-binding universal stress UspA family protein [Gillisia sp. Hel_I_86]
MKTILIPIDFSKESEKALSVGATIAKRISAKLVLAHMTGLNDSSLGTAPVHNATKKLYYSKLATKRFDEFLEKDFLKDVLVEPIMQHHVDFSSISLLADDISAALIVMGSSGSNGLSEVTTGSNTEKVVRRSNVPVLVVKKNKLNFSSETILFASDFKEESLDAYKRVSEIAKMLKAKINLLYINLPGKDFRSTKEMDEVLFAFFTRAQHPDPVGAIKIVNRYADFSIEEGIYNFSQLVAADIIAIPTHGRKGISHLIHGSISEDVANHSIIPVLTLRI